MVANQRAVKEWLAKNHPEMISCPNQPGKLMISKNACAKRYWMSRQEKYQDLAKGDFFYYAFKKGLSLCRDCPIGKKLAPFYPGCESPAHPSTTRRLPKSWGKLHFQRLS
ncbi:MAG: hypothetical protein HY882_05775 [Deltaproteobacteria bacterium]|nr:hypothetical protein [Deltaproteobacteria bacterium]